ncbi:MAG: hypothetical protein HFE83_13580 [Lachnospiraceae bacterium]|jgi:hypothetical protein|nr:hypothetical protein [Lachnospiraceae bacterium]
MRKTERLFRTRLIGGYHKADVDRYVGRLGEELEDCNREIDKRVKENEKNQELIEEAIYELRSLREENERLRGQREPYKRRL